MNQSTFRNLRRCGLLAGLLGLTSIALADSARDFLGRFEAEARLQSAGFSASASRGASFFKTMQGSDWSCASCHSDNPAGPGKHAKTGKPIDPLAPAANADRFVRADKVEKWFKRNCNDVLGRACSPAEKADVLAWLVTFKN